MKIIEIKGDIGKKRVNPFLPNVSFLYHLKTSENQSFSNLKYVTDLIIVMILYSTSFPSLVITV